MKRDMDLIRDLLFAIEEADWGFDDIEHINSIIDKKRHSFVTFHLKLLYEAKLIEGQVTCETGRRDFNDKMDLDMVRNIIHYVCITHGKKVVTSDVYIAININPLSLL